MAMPVYLDASRAATGMLYVLALSTLSSVCFLEAASFIVRTLTLSVASARPRLGRTAKAARPGAQARTEAMHRMVLGLVDAPLQ